MPMVEALCEMDPEGCDSFRRNALVLEAELAESRSLLLLLVERGKSSTLGRPEASS